MGSRLELHSKLVEANGNDNVYYDPPESVKMNYPAIRYSRASYNVKRADNTTYLSTNKYNVIVISRDPDNPAVDALLKWPMCRHDRHYVSDNLHHDSFTLYF